MRTIAFVLLLGAVVSAEEPAPQLRMARRGVSTFSLSRPDKEATVYVGLWNIMDGGGTFGVRYGKRRTEWLAFEAEASIRSPSSGHLAIWPSGHLVIGSSGHRVIELVKLPPTVAENGCAPRCVSQRRLHRIEM